MTSRRRHLALGAALLIAGACGFSPTAPFEGFDGQGSRVSGSFDSGAVAQSGEAGASQLSFEGIHVSVRERPSLSAVVGSDGTFEVVGVPSGSFTLVFELNGRVLGEIHFSNVRTNQEIVIVVVLIEDNEVVLVDEHRDHVSFEGECPRGAGFWCQNQGGKNPNLSAEEFERFAADAATLLTSVPALDMPEEVATAVCNTGDQLLRQLATLALNLAAETLSRDTALTGEPYATVGAAFDAAVALASGDGGTRAERNSLKDVLERINENENHDACENSEPDDDTGEGDDNDDVPSSGKLTICHIPPGNPANRHTISIDASAWPSHKAHGDTMGACS